MDERTLRVLEYPAIQHLVAERTASSLGRELAVAMFPVTELAEARRLQQQTSEARGLIGRVASPLGGVRDMRAQVRAAGIGGTLIASDLLDIASTLAASRRLRGLISQQEELLPRLAEEARDLGSFREIEEAIHACIDDRAEVKDAASDRLRSLRARLRTLQANTSRRLEAMTRSPSIQKMLSEPLVTVRRGRYCLPVRSEFRSAFGGILHDVSASGATCFMEPQAIVEMGNEVEATRSEEEEEVRRILFALSARVGEKATEIALTLRALAVLDFVFARAALSADLDGTEPALSDDGVLDFVAARHPLLKPPVVPIDVRLGDDFICLVITGPNTGGKTVTLKTVGLLTLMAQSGLHIPARAGSRAAVFGRLFADIGDEQSLQQSLSTFSSHMTQIVRVMNEATGDSLVLLDEIGAGTDPAEGSALAKAVLAELYRRGCRTVATTHYGELKSFAYSQPGVENASVEFDLATLRPTYHLRIGLPGASNAFAISAGLGLSRELILQAKEMMGESRIELDSALQRVEDDQRTLAEERRGAAEERAELQRARQEYEALARDLKRQRQEIIAAARQQARELISKAKRQGEGMLDLLRQTLAEVESRKHERRLAREETRRQAAEVSARAEAELAALGEEARRLAPAAPEDNEEAPHGEPVTEITRGQAVFVRSVRQRGTVITTPDDRGMVDVQVGILRISVPAAELESIDDTPQRATYTLLPVAPPVPKEIHLRGLRVEDAKWELLQYLDQAVEAGLDEIRVVHGKGTGAVRLATQELLRKDPRVETIRAALPGEGGEGATIAVLRS